MVRIGMDLFSSVQKHVKLNSKSMELRGYPRSDTTILIVVFYARAVPRAEHSLYTRTRENLERVCPIV